jgi:hypothetical protein
VFSKAGIGGDALEQLLYAQIIEHVQDGERYVREHRESIRRRVQEVEPANTAVSFYTRRKNKMFEDAGLIVPAFQPTKTSVLETIIGGFPDQLTTEEADQRVADGLRAENLDFDKRKDKNLLSRVRSRFGFAVTSKQWVRTSPPEKTFLPSFIYRVVDGTRPFGDKNFVDSECPSDFENFVDTDGKALEVQEDKQ